MVFKRLPGPFGVDGPTADPAPAAGPVRTGGPLRGEAHETQLTPALSCTPAAKAIEVALSANPGDLNAVLDADRQGGLFAEGHGPRRKRGGEGMDPAGDLPSRGDRRSAGRDPEPGQR